MPTRHSPDTCVGPCALARPGRWPAVPLSPDSTRASGSRLREHRRGRPVRVGEWPGGTNAALTALEPAASPRRRSGSPTSRSSAAVVDARRRRRHQRRRRDARRARRRHHRRRRRAAAAPGAAAGRFGVAERFGGRGAPRCRSPARGRRLLGRKAALVAWPRRSPTPPARGLGAAVAAAAVAAAPPWATTSGARSAARARAPPVLRPPPPGAFVPARLGRSARWARPPRRRRRRRRPCRPPGLGKPRSATSSSGTPLRPSPSLPPPSPPLPLRPAPMIGPSTWTAAARSASPGAVTSSRLVHVMPAAVVGRVERVALLELDTSARRCRC